MDEYKPLLEKRHCAGMWSRDPDALVISYFDVVEDLKKYKEIIYNYTISNLSEREAILVSKILSTLDLKFDEIFGEVE